MYKTWSKDGVLPTEINLDTFVRYTNKMQLKNAEVTSSKTFQASTKLKVASGFIRFELDVIGGDSS